MKVLFWNLYKKENSKYVIALLTSEEIDVAIFAEYEGLLLDKISSALNGYYIQYGLGGNDKIVAIIKGNIDVNVKREQSRYTLYTARIEQQIVHIGGVHLQANPHASSTDRAITLHDLTCDIRSLEKETASDNTIVIGDFNANPFSLEMISKKGMNAVVFKGLIDLHENVKHEGQQLRRFYNPTLLLLSEEKKQYGSYYYGSGSETLYWNMYDQVVMRKQLANAIVDMKYCKSAGNYQLVTKYGLPKKSISDHLPLCVEVKI